MNVAVIVWACGAIGGRKNQEPAKAASGQCGPHPQKKDAKITETHVTK
jgi:hypothetical protein